MALAQICRTLLQNLYMYRENLLHNLYMYREACTPSVTTAFQHHMCHTDSFAEIQGSFADM